MEEDDAIESRIVSKTIEGAQTRVEGYNFDIRKRVVEYDDVINKQRETIYEERDKFSTTRLERHHRVVRGSRNRCPGRLASPGLGADGQLGRRRSGQGGRGDGPDRTRFERRCSQRAQRS